MISTPTLIYIVALSIASMAFIFMFLLIRKIEITEERILKILGEDAELLKKVNDIEELKKAIINLDKKKRTKLKTLFESQDLNVAVDNIQKHILKTNLPENLDAVQD